MPVHPNFLGVPTREDIQALEQLRRQFMPMIGVLEKLSNDMMLALQHQEAINWTRIHHSINTVNSHLNSLNGYMNGMYKQGEETHEDSNGKLVSHHSDKVQEGQWRRIEALHVYPQAPFPMTDDRLAAMALVLVEKRLGTEEAKWVEERLRKAAEFAYVPGDWGIEPRKPAVKDEDEDDSDDEFIKGWDEILFTKRVKRTMNEDDLLDVWTNGHKAAFNKDYWVEMRFGMDDDRQATKDGDQKTKDGDQNMKDGEEGKGGEDEESEESEEYEDEEDEAPPPPPVVMIQRAPPAVHKGVPGAPVMPLGFVHRFMASGEVQQPTGQR